MSDCYWCIMGPIFLVIAGVACYEVHEDNVHPWQCVSTSKVKAILNVHGRDVDVLLENGNVVDVNQGHLAPGDSYCLQYERKK